MSTIVFNPTDNSDPWNTAWTVDIGQPAAAKQAVGVGFMRQYTGGIALVNPSSSSSQTFQLPASYISPSGTTVSSVTLAPTTGLILRSTSARAATTTGTTTTARTTTTVPTTTDSAPQHGHGHHKGPSSISSSTALAPMSVSSSSGKVLRRMLSAN